MSANKKPFPLRKLTRIYQRHLSLLTVGFAGFLSGTVLEKYKYEIAGMVGLEAQMEKLPSLRTEETRFLQVQNRTSQIMKYGFPGLDHVRSFDDYVLSYDRRNRVPHWVFEHLTKEKLVKGKVDRTKCDFMEDKSIHPYFRSKNDDFKGSGFDRGHMAAAGNHKEAQEHCDQTFYLTNIAPQVGVGFNRDSWNRLEKYVRKLVKTHPNVYVCTGPLYLPRKEPDGKMYVKFRVIGQNNVAVPTHFFKVVLVETKDGSLEMEAYVMPNDVIDDSVPLTSFQVPPDTIERHAGLLLFDQISREKLTRINGKKTTYI